MTEHAALIYVMVMMAAADGRVSQEELRLLELIRHGLPVGRLPAAAIERGARFARR